MFSLSKLNELNAVLTLRCIVISIQLVLILFVNLVLHYQLPWIPLIAVLVTELVFTFLSFIYFRKERKTSQLALFIQICADLVFLSFILYFSGGATNAFVSLLLIPIAIAAVTLKTSYIALVTLLAISSYSFLLWLLPMHVMHGNMEGHFIGMGINFLFSAIVLSIVVGGMARKIYHKELAIAAFREEQLKQEKVISLGVASAQITHQLATPISSAQMLVDEAIEDLREQSVLSDIKNELTRCAQSLASFREMVFDIKEQKVRKLCVNEIIEMLIDHVTLNYPEIVLEVIRLNSKDVEDEDPSTACINADASLVPAVLNLINNAVRATQENDSDRVVISEMICRSHWSLTIRDFGYGFTKQQLETLGTTPVESDRGFGMAVLLSHASLERLDGIIVIENHREGGALVTVSFPLTKGS